MVISLTWCAKGQQVRERRTQGHFFFSLSYNNYLSFRRRADQNNHGYHLDDLSTETSWRFDISSPLYGSHRHAANNSCKRYLMKTFQLLESRHTHHLALDTSQDSQIYHLIKMFDWHAGERARTGLASPLQTPLATVFRRRPVRTKSVHHLLASPPISYHLLGKTYQTSYVTREPYKVPTNLPIASIW